VMYLSVYRFHSKLETPAILKKLYKTWSTAYAGQDTYSPGVHITETRDMSIRVRDLEKFAPYRASSR